MAGQTGSRQEIQKKILEEIQQQKKQLQMKNQPQASGVLSSTIIPTTSTNLINPNDSLPGNQRAALQHAHAHSVGYFITQDSSFGNLILPVIPRLENK